VGNSEQGQKAAASHTANLGGAMALYRSAFRQTGIIQVEDMQDIFDWVRAFGYGKVPRGNRVAMITVSGGAGILMTDECIAWGLEVPQLAPQSIERLRKVVPAFAW
jgi:acyl-CoA synthetase (NDP forming)